VVRDLKIKLKSGETTQEAVDAGIAELLALKKSLPEEFQEKKEKKKKNPADAEQQKKALEARKAKKEAARKAREDAAKAKRGATAIGVLTDTYGDLPLAQSRPEDRKYRKWTAVKDLAPNLDGQNVLIRGHVHNVRAQAHHAFIVVRQSVATVQCVVNEKNLAKWSAGLSAESVVDIEGVLVKAPQAVKGSTQRDVEIQVKTCFVVNRAGVSLPFEVTAADHTAADLKEKTELAEKDGRPGPIIVGQELKLEHRNLSLRTPLQQAIMRVSSGVCHFFREFLIKNDFIEIQTPKLLGGSSEGGSEVFTTTYFDRPACLAQSPQLHKQICAACSGFQRVFEIGPVFRAENSNTSRHLCEFHGLDMEMAFNEHYHEVLDMFSDLFHYIFDHLNEQYKTEIDRVREYVEFEDLVYTPSADLKDITTVGTNSKTLLLTFPEAIKMLRADGVTEDEAGDLEDFGTEVEKRLGRLVKEKYGVDFYFLDKFPSAFRPFYTMPDPVNPDYSNSYDFFIRGQEILSGAQRVHDPDMLTKKIAEFGIPPESLKFYIDAFRNGALPHGGGGIGLERVVMLFLGLPNIRQACFFVRDPQRLTP